VTLWTHQHQLLVKNGIASISSGGQAHLGGKRQTHQRAVEDGTLPISQLLRRLGMQRQLDLRTDRAKPWKKVNSRLAAVAAQAQAPGGFVGCSACFASSPRLSILSA
jgi:hypothetical protein